MAGEQSDAILREMLARFDAMAAVAGDARRGTAWAERTRSADAELELLARARESPLRIRVRATPMRGAGRNKFARPGSNCLGPLHVFVSLPEETPGKALCGRMKTSSAADMAPQGVDAWLTRHASSSTAERTSWASRATILRTTRPDARS